MEGRKVTAQRPSDDWFREHLDDDFMQHVRDARENGYELVCVECGVGVADDSDMHERGCSKYVEFQP